MKHLLTVTETYRVDTVDEVEQLHQEMQADPEFALVAYSYKTKTKKEEEYQIVTAKKLFDEEKDPIRDIQISYNSDSSRGDF